MSWFNSVDALIVFGIVGAFAGAVSGHLIAHWYNVVIRGRKQ